ncbi:MAG: hypothetical protein NVS2B16_18190 [Chloroflexota bacterium]
MERFGALDKTVQAGRYRRGGAWRNGSLQRESGILSRHNMTVAKTRVTADGENVNHMVAARRPGSQVRTYPAVRQGVYKVRVDQSKNSTSTGVLTWG